MGDNDLSDWDEIDDEIDSFTLSVASSSVVHSPAQVQQANVLSWEASSSCASSSNYKVLDQFIGMGFSKKLAEKAIEENGEDNTEAILETLLTYSAIESPPHEQKHIDFDHSSVDSDDSFFDDLSDFDEENIVSPASEEENLLGSLITMGYRKEEAMLAIERCDGQLRIPNPMVGFGLPNEACQSRRTLPNEAIFISRMLPLLPKGDYPGPYMMFHLNLWIRNISAVLLETIFQLRTDFLFFHSPHKPYMRHFPRQDNGVSLLHFVKHFHLFQLHTVAYHFSVLRDKFRNGINVLSLFSGIGGAEVALDRLGIPMKNVVSVEISEVNRNIVQTWWKQTNQTGNLIHHNDVTELKEEQLRRYIYTFGGFDLVVGGSPCNNLTGSNRYHRDGLEGKDSSLFLKSVKSIMAGM